MSKKPAKSDSPSFENLMQEVEAKLSALEGGELTLEESLAAYEAGIKSLRQCHAMLKEAEGRIEIITNPGSKDAAPETADYDVETGTAKKKRAPKAAAKADEASEPADPDGTALF